MSEYSLLQQTFHQDFPYVYEWEDAPNYEYKRHFHKGASRISLLEGELQFYFEDGREVYLRKGQTFDVPQDVYHTAKVGPLGAKYLVGQELEEDESY